MRDGLQVYDAKQRLAYWSDVVSRCRSSNLSVRSWCEQEGVNEKAYYYWQRKIFNLAKQQEFVEVSTASNTKTEEIIATVTINGLPVDIHRGADQDSLSALIRAIKSC